MLHLMTMRVINASSSLQISFFIWKFILLNFDFMQLQVKLPSCFNHFPTSLPTPYQKTMRASALSIISELQSYPSAWRFHRLLDMLIKPVTSFLGISLVHGIRTWGLAGNDNYILLALEIVITILFQQFVNGKSRLLRNNNPIFVNSVLYKF